MRVFQKIAPHNLLLAGFLIAPAAVAHDFNAGALKIGHPWARATPPGAKVAGSYLAIENTGSTPDRLVGATISIANHVELHEMAMSNGVMQMRALPQGIEISPGTKVELKPGGLHLMWLDLTTAPVKGSTVSGTLRFENAGLVPVEFVVEPIGAPSSGHHGQ